MKAIILPPMGVDNKFGAVRRRTQGADWTATGQISKERCTCYDFSIHLVVLSNFVVYVSIFQLNCFCNNRGFSKSSTTIRSGSSQASEESSNTRQIIALIISILNTFEQQNRQKYIRISLVNTFFISE